MGKKRLLIISIIASIILLLLLLKGLAFASNLQKTRIALDDLNELERTIDYYLVDQPSWQAGFNIEDLNKWYVFKNFDEICICKMNGEPCKSCRTFNKTIEIEGNFIYLDEINLISIREDKDKYIVNKTNGFTEKEYERMIDEIFEKVKNSMIDK